MVKHLSCIPKTVKFEQLRQVFLDYMNVIPEYWHLAAGGLGLDAFRLAWPCKE